jgi:hypothetical protein
VTGNIAIVEMLMLARQHRMLSHGTYALPVAVSSSAVFSETCILWRSPLLSILAAVFTVYKQETTTAAKLAEDDTAAVRTAR